MRRSRRSVERKHMHFDLAAIPQTDAYKLLVSTVAMEPISLAEWKDGKR